jgi:hypothetical protein
VVGGRDIEVAGALDGERTPLGVVGGRVGRKKIKINIYIYIYIYIYQKNQKIVWRIIHTCSH